MGRRRSEINYILPKDVYMATLWYIRGYRRYLQQYEEILESSAPPNKPGKSGPGDPTFGKAAKLAEISAKLAPINAALERIPEEYRDGVLRAIVDKERYPNTAGKATWKRWRQRFVYYVALEAGFI